MIKCNHNIKSNMNEVHAVTKFTKESYEAFLRFTLYGKEIDAKWKSGKVTIAFFIILVALFTLLNFQISPLTNWLVITIIAIVILCFILIECVYFVPKEMAKSALKKTPRIFEFVSTFNFFDEHFVLDQVYENDKCHLEMRYSSLYKIAETEKYFYFHLQPQIGYILDKADITSGTVEQLSTLLENALDKNESLTALDAKKFRKYKPLLKAKKEKK